MIYTKTVGIRLRYIQTFGTDFRLGKESEITMKIHLPSGYSSEFYTNNHYYQPGMYDESELPPDLVAYLIKEGFAEYVVETDDGKHQSGWYESDEGHAFHAHGKDMSPETLAALKKLADAAYKHLDSLPDDAPLDDE